MTDLAALVKEATKVPLNANRTSSNSSSSISTSTIWCDVNETLLKPIKSQCRRSDAAITTIFRYLFTDLQRKSVIVRFRSFVVIDVLFMRSKLMRSLVCANMQALTRCLQFSIECSATASSTCIRAAAATRRRKPNNKKYTSRGGIQPNVQSQYHQPVSAAVIRLREAAFQQKIHHSLELWLGSYGHSYPALYSAKEYLNSLLRVHHIHVPNLADKAVSHALKERNSRDREWQDVFVETWRILSIELKMEEEKGKEDDRRGNPTTFLNTTTTTSPTFTDNIDSSFSYKSNSTLLRKTEELLLSINEAFQVLFPSIHYTTEDTAELLREQAAAEATKRGAANGGFGPCSRTSAASTASDAAAGASASTGTVVGSKRRIDLLHCLSDSDSEKEGKEDRQSVSCVGGEGVTRDSSNNGDSDNDSNSDSEVGWIDDDDEDDNELLIDHNYYNSSGLLTDGLDLGSLLDTTAGMTTTSSTNTAAAAVSTDHMYEKTMGLVPYNLKIRLGVAFNRNRSGRRTASYNNNNNTKTNNTDTCNTKAACEESEGRSVLPQEEEEEEAEAEAVLQYLQDVCLQLSKQVRPVLLKWQSILHRAEGIIISSSNTAINKADGSSSSSMSATTTTTTTRSDEYGDDSGSSSGLDVVLCSCLSPLQRQALRLSAIQAAQHLVQNALSRIQNIVDVKCAKLIQLKPLPLQPTTATTIGKVSDG